MPVNIKQQREGLRLKLDRAYFSTIKKIQGIKLVFKISFYFLEEKTRDFMGAITDQKCKLICLKYKLVVQD